MSDAHEACPSEPSPGCRIGPYRLITRLGEGGMGVVYLAERDDELSRRVALKLMRHAWQDPQALARFHIERRSLAVLSHPHIVTLLDGGTTAEGAPYLVMEYVEGLPLREHCRQAQPGLAERLGLFLQIASAVDYAHRHLIVHCDPKPANVLVSATGLVKLLDFGIAKLLSPGASAQLTQAGLRPFTPEYASPEQLRGEPLTTCTDIYGLGLILYELLAGSPAHRLETQDPAAIFATVCVLDPDPPSRRSPGVDPDLDAIVLKALRKDPRERYPSAAHMAEDVRRFLEGRPVAARKGTLRYKARKFVQRNKAAVAALALALATLVAGVSAVVWQARVAEAARVRAERRLAEVRKLARFLLFDFHDAVQNLPGATSVQRVLVERALSHLDGLVEEAAGDVELQCELVEAYTRFGDVQGNPYQPNLGDSQAALASYRKALTIAEPLALAAPGDQRVVRALAAVHLHTGDVLFLLRRMEEANKQTRQGISLLERALARDPTDRQTRTALASGLEGLGDQLGQGLNDDSAALEAFRASLAHWEEIRRLDPGDFRARRATAGLNMKIGQLLAARQPRAALESFRTALTSLDDLPAAERGAVAVRRLRGAVLRRLAECLWNLDDSKAALEAYQEAAAAYQALADLDPVNTRAQYDWAVALNDAGQALESLGDAAGALRQYDRVANILENLLKADSANVAWQAAHAEILVRIGGLLLKAGQPDEARRQTVRGLSRARRLADRPDLPPTELTRIARLLLFCQPADLRDPGVAVACARRAVDLTGGADAYALDTLAEAQLQAGDPEAARTTVQRALALLDGAGTEPSSWLRRMLEARLRRLERR